MCCMETYIISSHEVQPNGCVRISNLMKYFQKLACDDLDNSELSYNNLCKLNIAFVITRFKMKIYEDIKLYDNIEITTHARGMSGASFIRDFIVKVNGEKRAYASSEWVLFDLNKRTILRPSAISQLGTIPTSDEEFQELQTTRRKISNTSPLRTNVREVRYSNLDMNNHLNNTFYADYIFDLVSPEIRTTDKNMFLQIDYKTEARLGDKLSVDLMHFACDGYDIVAKNTSIDKVCFTSYLTYN